MYASPLIIFLYVHFKHVLYVHIYYGSMYMYIQLLYWATHKGGSKDRLISFYHLANGLALHT